ncbi:HAD-IA family hydrolase [Brucella sp. 191011898]|uniref:HAD-IA family hydrolase n=1 Tax=Brucella sp. 191011898 TaxID=2730447 RepID=UPI0015DF0BEC|nr:HAD-IA family hydrolase [Brucella sp. 191011898]CAB4327589.1 phosphoglycolate phosphatase [Brucella sp. 191011898]
MKLVLFDCDGTLVDSGDFIHRCMAASFADAGFAPPAVADTYSTIGLSLPLAIARLLGREPGDQVHWLTQRYKENFVTMRQAADFNEPLYEGILPLLTELGGRDDLLLGLVTGKSRRGVRSVFERHGIGHYFTVARTADDCPSKPHPAMVLESCAEMGIEPSRTIVIGDAIYDMQMARSVGAMAAGVSWGYHHRQGLMEAGAHHILEKPSDLHALLQEMEEF